MAKDKGAHGQDSKAGPQQQQQQQQQAPPSHEPSPVLRELHKRVRNTKKKIARCEELEGLRAAGHELIPEQVQSLAHKGGLLAVLEELGKREPLLKDAVKEEVKQENQVACEKQERRLRTRWQAEQSQKEAEQAQKEQAWQAERAELQHAAVQAREEKEEAH